MTLKINDETEHERLLHESNLIQLVMHTFEVKNKICSTHHVIYLDMRNQFYFDSGFQQESQRKVKPLKEE